MRGWVLGARGLLGRALVQVMGSENCLATNRQTADIGDLSALSRFVRRHTGITHIFNAAAFSLVDRAEIEREGAFQTNAIGPENLAKIAQEIGARLIHLSTDYIFPGTLHRPLRETDTIDPQNYYGQTKWEGEQKLLQIFPHACLVRVSWLFGPGGKNFVAKLWQMLQEEEEILLTDDQWGRPTYVIDLAHALVAMKDQSGIYHFANQGIATKYTFGCALLDLARRYQRQCHVKRLYSVPGSTFPSPCKRPVYSVFDTSKIEAVLGAPIRSWQQALEEHVCRIISS